jgi:hypothetical protein
MQCHKAIGRYIYGCSPSHHSGELSEVALGGGGVGGAVGGDVGWMKSPEALVEAQSKKKFKDAS